MRVVLFGLNHRTAPVQVRERLSVSDAKLPDVTAALKGIDGVEGAALVSTCNRVGAVISAGSEDVIEGVVDGLSARSTTTRSELEKHPYILRHGAVREQLFHAAPGR